MEKKIKCPNCNKTFETLTTSAQHNVETYDKSAIVRANCCKSLVRMYPIRTVQLRPYVGNEIFDDLGN